MVNEDMKIWEAKKKAAEENPTEIVNLPKYGAYTEISSDEVLFGQLTILTYFPLGQTSIGRFLTENCLLFVLRMMTTSNSTTSWMTGSSES